MSNARSAPRPRFVPDPRVAALVERYGAPHVGVMFALDGDAVRRYIDGASQRTTQWWIECHLERVAGELAAEDVARGELSLVEMPSSPPGEAV